MIFISQENEAISALLEALVEAKDLVFHKEPYLIVVGTIWNIPSISFSLQTKAVLVGPDSSIAFNYLFASFFVFGLEYPKYLDKFFYFFEQSLFNIFPKNGKINATTQEITHTLEDIAQKRIQDSTNNYFIVLQCYQMQMLQGRPGLCGTRG